jgi:glutamate carboxypeptidase
MNLTPYRATLYGARALFIALAGFSCAFAQTNDEIRAHVQAEKQPLLDTLQALVSIESGSSDYEGVTRIGLLVAERFRALGGEVEMVPPSANIVPATTTPERLADTVVARFTGRGTTRILLLAHMDTVYERGMLAQQPFRIGGDFAYGLGIADNKHGVALILHTISTLKALKVDDYGLITVLISPDEEIGSFAERDLITQLGSEHDIVMSFEGPGQDETIRLATTGVQLAVLEVQGQASHAGTAPEQGRNALYEMAHQILQMRDLSDAEREVKLNWTVAEAGSVPNAIAARAVSIGDMRANREEDFRVVENAIRERIGVQLIPDTVVNVRFEKLYPPLPYRPQSLPAAQHAQRVYAEVGGSTKINEVANGGGTDAAFAALRTEVPVIEGMGLRNFGSHSSNAEYINISSIEPRLYLATRMIMDVADGKVEGVK